MAGVLLALLLGNSVRVALLPSAGVPRRELALQAQISQAATRRGAQVAAVLGAVVVLMYRRLSGLCFWALFAPNVSILMPFGTCIEGIHGQSQHGWQLTIG